ncbi:hypothetical protein [Pseudoxanthomonas dokdonensis]|nr:hypothetical protein [Pseudoxanthomonas dokdonensis]
MGKAFADTGRGIKQAGTDAARYAVESNPVIFGENGGSAGEYLRNSLADQQATIDEDRRLSQPLMGTGAGVAGNVGGYLSTMLLPAAGLRSLPAARAAFLPTTLLGNAAQGAVMGGLQPVATGENRLTNVGLGAGAGAAGERLGKGLGALASRAGTSISPEARSVYEAARARGIDLTPAQLSDSTFIKRMQSMLRNMPFTGAQGRYADQVASFNKQLASTIGEDAARVDSNVYSMAKARQSRLFDDLTGRNDLKVDEQLVRSLQNIADSSSISQQVSADVNSAIDRLYAQAVTGPNGVTIPGRAYQAFDSELGQIIKSGGPTSHFLGNVQTAVRRAMDKSISPEDAAAWAQLRKEYGNRKTLAPLVAKASDGDISPPSLMGAVSNSKGAKEAMASGTRGELGELAKIGQRMKAPPSSGTAENMLAGGVFNPVNWPGYAAGAAVAAPVSRALDSTALAKLLMRKNPGISAKAAAKIANRMALPGAASYGNDRPLEIDITGGQSVPAAEFDRLYP